MSKVGRASSARPDPAPARECPAMDPADAARREDRDAGRVRGDHRRRHGRRRPAAIGQGRRETRSRRLPDRPVGRRGEREKRRLVQADQEPAAVDRDRRGDGAGRPDRRLGRRRHLEVLRVRQAVADERRFERDDRPAVGQGGRDLGSDVEQVGVHRWR